MTVQDVTFTEAQDAAQPVARGRQIGGKGESDVHAVTLEQK